ncbi:MAG TPA: hypothetical protein DCM87_12100 [Planctomycetes bacterium]|nr:hypothetical protein [Planctomycetota bacterium]
MYLGSAPGEIFSWRGIVRRIAVWDHAAGHREGGAAAPAVDIDFRGGPRDGVIASLPGDAAWNDEGIVLRDTRVALAPAQAEAFARAAGAGRPFSVSVWVSPERMDHAQRGTIVFAGENTWRCACRIGQRGRDVQFFVRTSVSGPAWEKPSLTAPAAGLSAGAREWRFIADGNCLGAAFDGRMRPERVVLRWWATPAGLLLASPAVFEPLTLYAAMFLAVAFLAGLASPPGFRGAAAALAIACIVPAMGIAALSAHCGVPIDRYAAAGVVLGAALGVPLGRAWACAARAG